MGYESSHWVWFGTQTIPHFAKLEGYGTSRWPIPKWPILRCIAGQNRKWSRELGKNWWERTCGCSCAALEVVHWNWPQKLRYPAIIVHLAPYSIPWNCVCPRKVRIEGLNNNYFSALQSVVEVIWLVVSNPLKNMLVSWDYSSHYMEKTPFIVDFPIKHGGVPSFFVGFQLFQTTNQSKNVPSGSKHSISAERDDQSVSLSMGIIPEVPLFQ